MAYHLVLQIPFGAALVSRETFEDEGSAEQYMDEHYPDFPAMEVLSSEKVEQLDARVVRFPEKTS